MDGLRITDVCFDCPYNKSGRYYKQYIKPFVVFYIIIYKDIDSSIKYYKVPGKAAVDNVKKGLKEAVDKDYIETLKVWVDINYCIHSNKTNLQNLYKAFFPN